MAKSKIKKATKKELVFVANWQGSHVDAARAAGYRHPEVMGARIAAKPHVAALLEKKANALAESSGKRMAKNVTITPNDIINRLDDLSVNAESDSAKVSALAQLADIYHLKDWKGNLFAGWTDEEKMEYALTGKIPERVSGLSND